MSKKTSLSIHDQWSWIIITTLWNIWSLVLDKVKGERRKSYTNSDLNYEGKNKEQQEIVYILLIATTYWKSIGKVLTNVN